MILVTHKPGEPREPLDVNFAASQVLDPVWFKTWTKLGLTVIAVQFDARLGSPIYAHPGIEEALGLELQEIGAGHFDSTFWLTGSAWHFFLCVDIGRAVRRLKSQLEIRGLLSVANILLAESPDNLTLWYSPDASLIGRAVEPSE